MSRRVRWLALIGIAGIVFAGCGSQNASTVAAETVTLPAQTVTVTATPPAPPTVTVTVTATESEATATPTETAAATGTDAASGQAVAGALTTAQQNAARKAEQYLSLMGFSHSGLIGQLEFEQFSTADATVAVDSLDVDWNRQAERKAESYLELSGFSRGGLIDQLVFEGFTRAQAEHGATAAGL